MTASPRDLLVQAIAAQEARLLELDRAREDVQSQLERLRTELGALDSAVVGRVMAAPTSDTASAMTSSEKVALFRSLFRGRDDVYPKLWENARTGKKGYAPACAKEWVRGVCEKPRVRCGECPNQAFLGVTDETIVDHLKGRHVVGVYPLLANETCWLLAVDFDKRSWMDDVGVLGSGKALCLASRMVASRSQEDGGRFAIRSQHSLRHFRDQVRQQSVPSVSSGSCVGLFRQCLVDCDVPVADGCAHPQHVQLEHHVVPWKLAAYRDPQAS